MIVLGYNFKFISRAICLYNITKLAEYDSKKQSRARVKWKNNALPYLNLGTIGAGLVYPGGNRWEGGFKPPLSAGKWTRLYAGCSWRTSKGIGDIDNFRMI